MSRTRVVLRDAVAGDAAFLADLWRDSLRRVDAESRTRDVEAVLLRVLATPDERVVLAEQDGDAVGAVLLRLTMLTPLHLEPVVQVLSPVVAPRARRRGVGRALMECALDFAEENQAPWIATAAASGERDANRFLARLGFGPLATYRTAPTSRVRGRLVAMRPERAAGSRSGERVVAARRSMRRPEHVLPEPGVVGPPLP